MSSGFCPRPSNRWPATHCSGDMQEQQLPACSTHFPSSSSQSAAPTPKQHHPQAAVTPKQQSPPNSSASQPAAPTSELPMSSSEGRPTARPCALMVRHRPGTCEQQAKQSGRLGVRPAARGAGCTPCAQQLQRTGPIWRYTAGALQATRGPAARNHPPPSRPPASGHRWWACPRRRWRCTHPGWGSRLQSSHRRCGWTREAGTRWRRRAAEAAAAAQCCSCTRRTGGAAALHGSREVHRQPRNEAGRAWVAALTALSASWRLRGRCALLAAAHHYWARPSSPKPSSTHTSSGPSGLGMVGWGLSAKSRGAAMVMGAG